jgi:diketogulonate reductase-like aldo/keto reductase
MNATFPSAREGLQATAQLNNGVQMPWLGLGVYQTPEGAPTIQAVHWALEAGYRHIDTAALYGNERSVGEAVRSSGLPREQVFVTTKVWNDDQRRGRVRAAFDESLRKLNLDYIDLYLVHWPVRDKIRSTWAELEKLRAEGMVRSIGVSNFLVQDLEHLLAAGGSVPVVNQIEFHPYLQSPALVGYCRSHQILVEAWSPLMQAGTLLEDPVIEKIARAHGKTPAQVVLRWDLQCGVATIPKSARQARIMENGDIFGFSLSADEMRQIEGLNQNHRSGADPATFTF